MKRLSKNESGFILYLFALLMAAISAVAIIASSRVEQSMGNMAFLIGQTRGQYIRAGVRVLNIANIQNCMKIIPVSKLNDVSILGCLNALPRDQQISQVAPGYHYNNYPVTYNYNNVGAKLISSGIYQGMKVNQTVMDLSFSGSNRSENSSTFSSWSTILLGTISPFQFVFFADAPYVDFAPATEGKYTDAMAPMMAGSLTCTDGCELLSGTVHVNGDLCLLGSLFLTNVNAAGRIMNGLNPLCFETLNNKKYATAIATGSTATSSSSYFILKKGEDNGCKNCAGSGQDWPVYSKKHWNGQLLDVANGVSRLRLPGQGVDNITQMGVGTNFSVSSNKDNMRFIIDPPLQNDSDLILTQKFAYNADIRIIDGIWYLKDPQQPKNWPGIPIWSDHPGSKKDVYLNHVGQDDLKKDLHWTSVPQYFSYYSYDSSQQSISGSTGVVSYGNVALTTAPATSGAPGYWTPGGFIDPAMVQSDFCGGMHVNASGQFKASLYPYQYSPKLCYQGSSQNGQSPDVSTLLLNGTRSGFVNGHIQFASVQPVPSSHSVQNIPRSNILPMNLDISQLVVALKQTNKGELGSYFGSHGLMGRDFNGIIYVSATWPGSLDGFGSSVLPREYPFQGSVSDKAEPNPIYKYVQQSALPYPLCSDPTQSKGSHKGNHNVGPGDSFDKVGYFKIPNCEDYSYLNSSSTAVTSYINAIRITNAHDLSGFQTSGLSVVSNLPVYITGNYNATSSLTVNTSRPWVSALVAGDQVSVLSNNWSDSGMQWGQDPDIKNNIADTTTINTALLTGFARVAGKNQFHAIPALMEYWGKNIFLNFNGSIVVGYYPVNQRSTIDLTTDTASSGNTVTIYGIYNRNFNFDPHFSEPSMQPPGSIVYWISAILSEKKP